MKSRRQWTLYPDSPYEIRLAADARLSQTDYTNDQSWDIVQGHDDQPALAIQTKYGGRVGLASIVPMWHIQSDIIYQANHYHQAPVIRTFLPGYVVLDASIRPDLQLSAQHFAFDSQSIAGFYQITNHSSADQSLRFDLFAHVGAQGQEQKLAVLNTYKQTVLGLGNYANLAPIIMLEHGTVEPVAPPMMPKLGISLQIPAGKSVSLRWVHAGLASYDQSVRLAAAWLSTDWQAFAASISTAASEIPVIQTGNDDWDIVIASSYNRIVQSLMKPALQFKGATMVSGRKPQLGYSRRSDGSDHHRMWEGQDIQSAYLFAPLLATIEPGVAQQIIQNYLASQDADGAIDLKPGPSGQRANLLCSPLLASTALRIYQASGDQQFLGACFEALLRFVAHWLSQDVDHDGVPEWQHDRQIGYPAFPTFAAGQLTAQGANPATVESPDLLAWLIAETSALESMAAILKNKPALMQLQKQSQSLRAALQQFWNGERYSYRDRDTHRSAASQPILNKGAGDQQHRVQHKLEPANRLLITIVGGVSHRPDITLHVEGLNAEGSPIRETATVDRFYWQNRQGVYTTAQVFSLVQSISCEGLSRVYTISVSTVDTTLYELTALVPVLVEDSASAIAQSIASAALDSDQFMRPNGITMMDARTTGFDPSSADGAGGAWLFWQTVLGRQLLRLGYGKQIVTATKKMLDMQVQILKATHEFAQFYHSDEPRGLGEPGHLHGIAPLDLLHDIWGIRILNPATVALSKDFFWNRSVTIQQHGILVRRSGSTVKIVFASGHKVELKSLDQNMLIQDPSPAPRRTYLPIAHPALPEPESPAASARSVRIPVEVEE